MINCYFKRFRNMYYLYGVSNSLHLLILNHGALKGNFWSLLTAFSDVSRGCGGEF